MKNLSITVIVMVAILVGGYYGFISKNNFGSVSVTSEYRIATTTNDNVIPRNSKVCYAGQTFGGVLVSTVGAAGGTFDLYDGTTTQSHPDTATTTIAHFASNTAVGYYPFDITLRYGLVIDPISNTLMGSTTFFCR